MCDICCIASVHQSTIGVVESFGKFSHTVEPGCVCINCCTSSISGRVSLRVREFSAECESKSRDNVMINVKVIVMIKVLPDRVQDAHYRLSDPRGQIISYAQNVIRGMLAQHTLDEVFLLRNEMQKHLVQELGQQLKEFGYQIVAALVSDIDIPDKTLKHAMEQTVTNARKKQATVYRADSQKMVAIINAEAGKEAKRLSGVGLAEQRKAAIAGLQQSVTNFEQSVQGMSPKDVMSLLLMNQYFDAIKEIVEVSHGHTTFLPDCSARSVDMIEGMMASSTAVTTAQYQQHARRQAAQGRQGQ